MINEQNITSGTKVRALTTRQSWEAGDEFIYLGGCDHDTWGWAIQLEGGEPFNLPGETPQTVGHVSTTLDVFQTCFEEVGVK